jgi:hypothetical protein
MGKACAPPVGHPGLEDRGDPDMDRFIAGATEEQRRATLAPGMVGPAQQGKVGGIDAAVQLLPVRSAPLNLKSHTKLPHPKGSFLVAQTMAEVDNA